MRLVHKAVADIEKDGKKFHNMCARVPIAADVIDETSRKKRQVLRYFHKVFINSVLNRPWLEHQTILMIITRISTTSTLRRKKTRPMP